MTAEDTSSYLISTMQGFQLATDQAERIADKYNEVANHFAIDTKGIGEALQRSAASFNAANTDLSEAIALVTATNTVVQDPSSVGTLWKTLSARIRGAKTELEELGEEEDEFTQTTSKLQDLVKGLTGFDILEADQQTFKSIYDIIIGIGKEWQNLSDIEQASLGEALAGKRNANALYAVLNNIETLEKAYQTAEKSAGSAAKEQENYAQSVQYSIDRAKASIEELSYDFLNSQFLKSAIELGNSFIQVLDKIVEHTNALADTFVLLGAYIGIKFRRNIATFASDATKYLAEIGAKAQLAGMASTEMSASMAGLTTLLTKFGPMAAGVALVTTAVVLGAKAWDNYQTSVKEWNDKISETEGKISSLKGEIEQLQNIDFRTQDEQNRLDLLKSELGYQERLLEVEKKRINQQKYGFDTFAEAWDRDNANNVLREDTMKRGQAGLGTVHDASLLPMGYDSAVVLQAALDIEEYNKKLKTLDKDSEEYTKTLEDKEKAELKSSDSLEQLYIDTADYRQKLKDAEEAQKEFINGSDAWNNAENIIATYSQWIDENERAIKKFEKATGVFDYSSVIESELSKTKYNGLESRLVDLAKQGKLTKDNLAQYYGKDLVEALAPLEISLDEIYNYIVRISGLVDRKNFVQKVSDSMASIPSGETQLSASSVINGVMRDVGKAAFETWVNNLSEEDAKLLVGIDLELSAYDNWNDVLNKYQEELNKAKGNPLEVGIDATITDSVEGISKRLKSQFDELGELYKSIFYGDDNKFSLEKVTNEQLESLRKAFVDAEDERGEKIGVRFAGAKEAVDEFIDTITSAETKSKSLADQQKITQDAVNKLATKYFYAADGLKELNKDTKDAIEQQLKQLGIANAAEIVDYYTALANGERIATDNNIDLANATADAIAELVTEGKVAPITGQALAMLALQKQLAAGITFGESGNIQQIENLAKAAGAGAIYLEKLARAKQIAAEVDKGNYGRIPELEAITKELETFDFSNSVNVDFSNITNDNKNARNAGKSDADAYVEAYKKEKEKLQSDREAGLIDESTYLDKLKALIDKFFKDRAKYAKNYIDEMKEYLEGVKSLYDSAISGVSTIIQKKIDAANKGKDAAVKALNEEKEAAEERYQAEIDAIQAQMDAIDDLIDKKNDEKDAIQDQIDAINEANEARDRSIQLQKAEYDLQRSMNQRTRLVYTGEPGQMVYERDESSVRDARESLQDAQDEIAIAALEKQIKLIEDEIELLEKQKNALSDQQEGIQKMMESSSKYYEKLIKEQEKYWDSVVEGLEKQKAKWEELTEIETIANAYSAIEQVFGPLGYKVEDVINGSETAFEDFKNKYIQILQEMNTGNQPFLDGLDYATNSAKGAFSEISSSAGEIKDALGEVADATTPLADAATNITNMGSAASTASSGMGSLKTATDGIASDVTELNNVKFDGLTKALDDVKKDIEGISNLLVGPTDSIESALIKLNDETVLAQLGQAFEKLSESISSVAGMLGAGGGNKEDTDASSESMGGDAGQGSTEGSGLASGIQKIKEAADEFIGMSVDDEGETAIGRFNLLKSAIKTLVDEVIGNTEIEGTLIGSINSLPQITDEALNGDEGAIALFKEFEETLRNCATEADNLLSKLKDMEGIHLPSLAGGEGGAEGEYTGTANYDGDWRVGKNEKSLVGELGPELVLRNGKAITVGKDGPEFVNLKKDDIVLNHLQTAAILDKKNQIRTLADGTVLTPIDRKTLSLTGGLPSFSEIRNLVNDQTKAIQESISKITTINNEPKVTINNPSFTVSGVTGEEVMRKIEGSFEGLMLNAYQKAMS